ncbi:NAD-dependent epimerase/dehydratase [Salinisphaera shabanensis T35B1]
MPITIAIARQADALAPRVAVTGASGFIGSTVTRALAAEGWQVRALTRTDSWAGRLRDQGLEVTVGSLAEPAALDELVTGVDAVVHCAGAVRGSCYADFAEINVAGTENLIAAMAGRHLPLVALSSLAAREPQLSDYARSKQAMEALLAETDIPLDCLVLRPPAVYGPGDTELKPLFDAFARGLAPLPGAPDARVSLLYVDDLAAAIVAWLNASERTGGVYEIGDASARGYSWDEVVRTAETLLERRIRRIPVPGAALDGVAWVNTRMSRWLGYAPMLTPGKLQELRHADWVCDNRPLQQMLDWAPQVDLAAGLKTTCGWGRAA